MSHDPEHDIPDERQDESGLLPPWFCGCGMPEEAAAFLREVLDNIRELREAPKERGKEMAAYDRFAARQAELLPSDGLRYLLYYLLNHVGVLEHGGSVPGWLSDEGKALLERLRTRPEDFE